MPSLPSLRTLSLVLATLALALIAGFFYAYEVSVMRGFARLSDREFISAMQAVNATVRNLPFAMSFFGAAVLAILAVILHVPVWRTRAAFFTVAATVIYIGGGLLLTMTVNVPMNEWLASLGPSSRLADPAAVRLRYEGPWVFWNLVRTVCSTLALLLMVVALWLDGYAEGRSGR